MNTIDEATTLFRVSLFDGDESFNRYYRAANRDEAVRFASRGYPELDINSCTQMAAGWLNVYHVVRCDGGPEEGGWTYDAGTLECAIDTSGMTEGEACQLERLLRLSYPKSDTPLHSVLSDGDYYIEHDDKKGKSYPDHRPHYE
tara:strand:- start:78 stop:509 length:432 start_codon:yes stop_codon:yes gene_type:complete